MTPEQVEYLLNVISNSNVMLFSLVLINLGLIIGKLIKIIIKKIRKN